jgi:hypothetical protein
VDRGKRLDPVGRALNPSAREGIFEMEGSRNDLREFCVYQNSIADK